MKTTQAILIGVGILFGIALVIVGSWGYRYYTAEVRGVVSQEEKVECRDFRMYNYEHFYDLKAAYNAYDDQIEAQEERLTLVESPSARERVLSNIAGLKSQKARVRETYNANARKIDTRARFLGDDLPKRLE